MSLEDLLSRLRIRLEVDYHDGCLRVVLLHDGQEIDTDSVSLSELKID